MIGSDEYKIGEEFTLKGKMVKNSNESKSYKKY